MDQSKGVVVMFIVGLAAGYFYGSHKVEQQTQGDTQGHFTSADLAHCKMVLVIRNDMPLAKGKLAEQCAQATLACYEVAVQRARDVLRAWKKQGQAKVTLKCKGQDQLIQLQKQAEFLGLVSRIVVDPQYGPSILGIGPGPATIVNKVTGELSLY